MGRIEHGKLEFDFPDIHPSDEGATVRLELTVEDQPPMRVSQSERAAILRQIAAEMKAESLSVNAPAWSREQLYSRERP